MSSLRFTERLRAFHAAHGGVYSTADLAVLLGSPERSRVTESLRALLRDGVLLKVRRGLYADCLNGHRPEIAGLRWLAPSYLSTESALNLHGLCHTGITAFTYVTPRLIPRRDLATREFDGYTFIYRHLARHLFFGYRCQDGLLVAEPEKAALDFLYFAYKDGSRLSALALQDIDFTRLDPGTYRRYLRPFRQRGFAAHALSLLERGRNHS